MENSKIKVGINGFGRIGRAFYRIAWNDPRLEVVAINDLGSFESMAYLLKYDSVYRDHGVEVTFTKNQEVDGVSTGGVLHIQDKLGNTKDLVVFAEKEPKNIPWGSLDVDVVVESTGFFTDYDKAHGHIEAGAKKVVISAPAKVGVDTSIQGEMILLGINEDKFGTTDVTSNASCTTNGASPLIVILDQSIGIDKANSTSNSYY
jgi:glyceraldehyde 3-phosphate dehydrogenase